MAWTRGLFVPWQRQQQQNARVVRLEQRPGAAGHVAGGLGSDRRPLDSPGASRASPPRERRSLRGRLEEPRPKATAQRTSAPRHWPEAQSGLFQCRCPRFCRAEGDLLGKALLARRPRRRAGERTRLLDEFCPFRRAGGGERASLACSASPGAGRVQLRARGSPPSAAGRKGTLAWAQTCSSPSCGVAGPATVLLDLRPQARSTGSFAVGLAIPWGPRVSVGPPLWSVPDHPRRPLPKVRRLLFLIGVRQAEVQGARRGRPQGLLRRGPRCGFRPPSLRGACPHWDDRTAARPSPSTRVRPPGTMRGRRGDHGWIACQQAEDDPSSRQKRRELGKRAGRA